MSHRVTIVVASRPDSPEDFVRAHSNRDVRSGWKSNVSLNLARHVQLYEQNAAAVSITCDDHTSAQLSCLSLERVDRIHAAIGVGAGRSCHALVIGRELAIARISPGTSLQAIDVLPRRGDVRTPPRSGARRRSKADKDGKCKHTDKQKVAHGTSSLH